MELNLQKFSSLNIEINVFQFLFPAFPICEQSPHNHFYNGSCSHYLTWKHFSLVGVIVLALYTRAPGIIKKQFCFLRKNPAAEPSSLLCLKAEMLHFFHFHKKKESKTCSKLWADEDGKSTEL